jgi:hypothetical protein
VVTLYVRGGRCVEMRVKNGSLTVRNSKAYIAVYLTTVYEVVYDL